MLPVDDAYWPVEQSVQSFCPLRFWYWLLALRERGGVAREGVVISKTREKVQCESYPREQLVQSEFVAPMLNFP